MKRGCMGRALRPNVEKDYCGKVAWNGMLKNVLSANKCKLG